MVTLAEELPFAAVVEDEHLEAICSSCFTSKRVRPLSMCTRCRVVHYCGKDCQKNDWATHKYECKFMQDCFGVVPSAMFRLIARIALKLKSTETHEPAFNGRVYEELMDHVDEIQTDPERLYLFNVVSNVLRQYMDKKFIPKSSIIMSIFGKITTNNFSITDENSDPIGQGLYIGLSVHNHSCAPDAFVHFDGIKAVLRSPDIDKTYSKDICVTYIDLLESNPDRKKKLQSIYCFTCTCSLCSDPTRDFLYNSARSKCCPDSYCLLDPDAKDMTCYKCGSIAAVAVDEAIAANDAIRAFCENFEECESSADLMSLISTYEMFSEILSPLNINLLLLNDMVVHNSKSRNRQLCSKYAAQLLPAYRRYLTVGSPVLTSDLMYLAISQSLENPPTGAVLNLLEEANAAALISHGPGHRLTSCIDRMLSKYRIRLQASSTSDYNLLFCLLVFYGIICLVLSILF